MKTVNISLTSDQFEAIEKVTRQFGFANRSELIRAILRFVLRKPEAIADVVSSPFVSPDTKDIDRILTSFKETGKYSKEFLQDLEEGLKESTYFTE